MSITHSDGIFPVFRWVRVCLSFLIGNIVKASVHFFRSVMMLAASA